MMNSDKYINGISGKEKIKNLLDSYNVCDSQERKIIKKHLKSWNNHELVVKMIDREIKSVKSEDKFKYISLGFFVDRQHFLLQYVDNLYLLNGENAKKIFNETNFFEKIEQKALTNREEKSIVEHIRRCEDFNVRFLEFLSDENKVLVLNYVYKNAKTNGLTIDHLDMLNVNKEFINRPYVQRLIRDNLNQKEKYIKYLDLKDAENQKLLSERFDFFEIHKRLSLIVPLDIKSDYFNLRVAVNLINKKLSDEDLPGVKKIITERINSIEDISKDEGILGVLKDLSFKDKDFAEEKLVDLYTESKGELNYNKRNKQTKKLLEALIEIKSSYSYIELKRIIRSTNDNNVRYACAFDLIKNYQDKSSNIIDFLLELGDESLTNRIKNEIKKEKLDFSFDNTELNFVNGEQYQFRKKSVYKTLNEFANSIKATVFYAATGYVYSSGLNLLENVLNCVKTNNGTIEIISGSLQKYTEKGENKKINKETVILLNKMIAEDGLKLYTFTENFYHGKFYYLANDEIAYAIIGSSNISKTAFKENKELDLIFKIDLTSGQNEFLEWYENFKEECTLIENLNENNFLDIDWESELDIYTEGFSRKITDAEIDYMMKQANSNTDYEEMKLRFDVWRKLNPTKQEKIEDITAFKDYVVFFYSDCNLAVFESIKYGNACYYMACEDYNFENLLLSISEKSRKKDTEELGIKHKNHPQGIENLEKMINDIFKEIKTDMITE